MTNAQDTNSKQIPIFNNQSSNNPIALRLVIGIWLLTIIWLLEIGAWLLKQYFIILIF
jgi:hypothetical protein